jgi:hypothetical protein
VIRNEDVAPASVLPKSLREILCVCADEVSSDRDAGNPTEWGSIVLRSLIA